MKVAIHLQTKYGYEMYRTVWMQFEDAKRDGSLDQLKAVLYRERNSTEKDLIDFLSDDTMIKKYKMNDEDIDGWNYYKQTADRFSVLNYFYLKEK
jgi:hypothetical protein